MPSNTPGNALTIDVEDYFQVSAFAPHIPRSDLNTRECRVERNVDCILEMLDQHETKPTFFTLGWVAERYPEVIQRIAENTSTAICVLPVTVVASERLTVKGIVTAAAA